MSTPWPAPPPCIIRCTRCGVHVAVDLIGLPGRCPDHRCPLRPPGQCCDGEQAQGEKEEA